MTQAFIDKSVAFQLGDPQDITWSNGAAAFNHAKSASSGSTLFLCGMREAPYGVNGWYCEDTGIHDDFTNLHCAFSYVNRDKHAPVAQQIHKLAPGLDFAVDMQDRRARDLCAPDNSYFPTFSFNRTKGARGRILWPLPIYHDLGSDHFLGNITPDFQDWNAKKSTVIWRGITGGRAVHGPRHSDEGQRLRAIDKKFRKGRITEDTAMQVVRALPRWAAVKRAMNDPRYDFGFVDGDGYLISETPFHDDLEKPRLSRKAMQRHKYIAVLRGLDVGSSFYWTMNSGSVGLVMDTPFETFGSCHFNPWEHYIPFAQDLSDLDERYDWAESHPAECQKMARRAAEVCTLLGSADLRRKIQHAVVAEVAALTA